MTLMCMASFAFSVEPTSIAGLMTSGQTLGGAVVKKPHANLTLVVPRREAVLVPKPFDIFAQEFTFCVNAEREAPELTLSAVNLDYSGRVALCGESATSEFKITHPPAGKIVTLLLAPE